MVLHRVLVSSALLMFTLFYVLVNRKFKFLFVFNLNMYDIG